nr:6-phospho-3-hexuloisomerase [Candidatus Njordarchaeum guaymaensis]
MSFERAFSEILTHLEKFHDAFNPDIVDKIASMMSSSERVFSYGAGRSGLVARCFAQRLMHLGLKSYFLGETITPSLNRDDILLVVSGSGETLSSATFIREARNIGAKTIALTSKKDSTLGRIANLVSIIPGKTKTDKYESAAPFTSLFDISALVFLDCLASELMKKLGVTEEDILKRHATIE